MSNLNEEELKVLKSIIPKLENYFSDENIFEFVIRQGSQDKNVFDALVKISAFGEPNPYSFDNMELVDQTKKLAVKSLNDEFSQMIESKYKEIQTKIFEASESLNEAVRIADEYGLSFYSDISPISQAYLSEKFSYLSEDHKAVVKIMDDNESFNSEYEGWQHSDIC